MLIGLARAAAHLTAGFCACTIEVKRNIKVRQKKNESLFIEIYLMFERTKVQKRK
jgi:hypothetical protein